MMRLIAALLLVGLLVIGVVAGELHQAVKSSDFKQARQLLVDGANPNELDECGMGPIHYAAEHGDWWLIDLFLEFNADINLKTIIPNYENYLSGQTALHIACLNNQDETVDYLVHNCAQVNTTDCLLRTPLFYAQSGSAALALCNDGANIEIHDSFGFSPLSFFVVLNRWEPARILAVRMDLHFKANYNIFVENGILADNNFIDIDIYECNDLRQIPELSLILQQK